MFCRLVEVLFLGIICGGRGCFFGVGGMTAQKLVATKNSSRIVRYFCFSVARSGILILPR